VGGGEGEAEPPLPAAEAEGGAEARGDALLEASMGEKEGRDEALRLALGEGVCALEAAPDGDAPREPLALPEAVPGSAAPLRAEELPVALARRLSDAAAVAAAVGEAVGNGAFVAEAQPLGEGGAVAVGVLAPRKEGEGAPLPVAGCGEGDSAVEDAAEVEGGASLGVACAEGGGVCESPPVNEAAGEGEGGAE
jgi:hypothetical protein